MKGENKIPSLKDQWNGCYDIGWNKNLVPEAFSHPAKVSFSLAGKIYDHIINLGWVKKGDLVLDPFGGICGFGFHALCYGLNFIAVELEEKFVSLGQQNIDLWNRQLKGWPNLGTARIVQGDSRKLGNVIEKADLVVSSPPFTDSTAHDNRPNKLNDEYKQKYGYKKLYGDYGHTPGNLANMKEGDIDLVVSSPPFCQSDQRKGGSDLLYKTRVQTGRNPNAPSQVPNMGHDPYGQSPGQLGSMKEGNFDLCVSSPPYERSLDTPKHGNDEKHGMKVDRCYPKNQSNLGNSSGDTFWSASREIVQQCYELLKDGGHAIWVTKDYVKKGQRVPFSDRWLALCESVGFKLICRHQAILVKEYGTQVTIHGDEKISTERKSFFRRLAESKGSPRIDEEDVICMVKD